MKRILLIAAFASLAVGPGLAADMAIKAAPAPAPAAAAAFDWSGFYIGGDAGGQDSRIRLSSPTGPLTYEPHHSSFALGAFIGAQAQFGQWVLGVEGDYVSGFGRASLGATPAVSIFIPGGVGTAQAKLKDIWSVGARLGWAMGHWMPYLTAGYASGSFEFDAQSALFTEQASVRTRGAYIGGGVDWVVASQAASAWIFGIEYRHYGFGTKTGLAPFTPPLFADQVRFAPASDTVMARLSYKFGPMK